MIPTSEQLRSISLMRSGNLAEIPFGVLLHALAAHRRTVVLEIERPPLKKAIVLEHGNPVDCQSNMLHETLSRFMAERGILGEEESQNYFNSSVSQGIPFGELLTREGKLSASELFRILQQNLAKKLLDGFSWRTGTFQIHSDVPEVDSPLKVNAPQLVVTGISKFALADEVNSAVGPLVGKRLVLNPSPPFPLQDLRLSKEQQQLIDYVRVGKRIDELAAETTVPFERIMRLLYSMAVIGIIIDEEHLAAMGPSAGAAAPPVELERGVPSSVPPTTPQASLDAASPASPVSPVSPAPSPPVAGPSLDAASRDREHNQLMEAYLRYRKQDAFELFGLEDGATVTDVQRAYLRFSQRYAPWKFDVPGLSKLVEKAEDLFLAGGRAFGELCDVERRNALIQRRRTLRQGGSKKPARDRFMIKSELLDPAVQFRKGKALMKKQRYREAIQQLQFAVDCDPQNSLYRSELAYCKYLDRPDIEASQSLEELDESLRIDPKCGIAVLYSGQILGDLEQYDEAEDKLRHAIKMMMPDRRAIEALKALQAHRKSKKKRRFLGG